jgi:hypothetical protein
LDAMTFWDAVHAEPGLTWLGVTDDDVMIRGPLHAFAVNPTAIEEEEWESLRDVLLERRLPIVLTTMSRVVGYFSNQKNWNRSKLAEGADRRKGNYVVTGELDPVPIPEFIVEVLALSGAELACHVGSPTTSVEKS